MNALVYVMLLRGLRTIYNYFATLRRLWSATFFLFVTYLIIPDPVLPYCIYCSIIQM